MTPERAYARRDLFFRTVFPVGGAKHLDSFFYSCDNSAMKGGPAKIPIVMSSVCRRFDIVVCVAVSSGRDMS